MTLFMVNFEENVKLTSVGRFDRQVQCLISSWQFPSRLEPPPRRWSGSSRQTWETANKDKDLARPIKKCLKIVYRASNNFGLFL